MLRGTVAFLVLVACAVFGAELRSALARRGVRAPGMEGVSFLAVGFLLGGRALGLFPDDLVAALRVVVLFGLAWIGLVFGLQAEWRIIRRLAPWHRWIGALSPIAVGVPVAVAAVLLDTAPALALGLAAVAMASTPSALESLARGRRTTDRGAVRLLKLVMAFAGIPSVAVFAVATALASPLAGGGGVGAHELLLFTAAIGLLVGYAVVVLVRGVSDHMQLLTLAIGSMCLVAGASAVLGLNPLPAAALGGAVLVNRSVFPHRMLRVAHSLERPILVALLVLIGASWSGAAFSIEAFAVMTVVRLSAALAAGAALGRVARARGEGRIASNAGWGLLPQGELSLGLTVAIVSFFPATRGVLEAVVAAMLLNNLIGGWWMRRRLFAPPDRSVP